ncbi:VWA domain-containing protein [Urechidicola sp. KH5]
MDKIRDFATIDMELFHFLRPQFLWALIPVLFILILLILKSKNEVKWQKNIAEHLRPYVIKKGSESLKKWMQLTTLFTLLIAILGLAGPTWKKIEVPGQVLETPVVILLDLSQSMMAEDLQPNRLERAKFKISDLIEANPTVRLALIGYAGTAHTIVPLTNDYRIIKTHISSLSPKIMPFRGNNLPMALQLADTICSITDAPASFIVFSDDFEEESFQILQNYATNHDTSLELVPMNTLSGAFVPNYNGRGVLKNTKGEEVYSKRNETILSQLNAISNITIHDLTLDKSDMELLASKLSKNAQFKEADQEKEDAWEDYGLFFILPFLIVILMSFRKGWVLYITLSGFLLTSCSSDSSFKDLWLTKDYQAQQFANKGNYNEAGNTYQDPLRKGIAYYKAKNYGAAIAAFEKDTTALGAYNLGIAYMANGNYTMAQQAFKDAVELDPDLAQDTNKNQQLATQLTDAQNEVNPEDAEEAPEQGPANNKQNDSMEDLSGGGQEATEEDMKKERLEETVTTDMRKGKELDEVPDDIQGGQQQNNQKVLLRKIDDDPALFLQRKFKYQVKQQQLKPTTTKQW